METFILNCRAVRTGKIINQFLILNQFLTTGCINYLERLNRRTKQETVISQQVVWIRLYEPKIITIYFTTYTANGIIWL